MHDLDQFKRMAVHAKHLLMHGCTHATSMQPVQRMIAVHDIHNAVEWLLGGLWQYYYSASEEKPWTMMTLFDRISKDKKLTLILRREISMLNEARNQAQHHAIPPSIDVLNRYVMYVESFFRQTLRDVSPECEYDTLFLGLLLSSDLDFWIDSDCFPPMLSTWLGAEVEAIDPLPDCYDDIGEPWFRHSLNLRKVMLQAEGRMQAFPSEGSEARDAATIVLEILACCLIFGQLLARRGFRRLRDPIGTQPPDERSMDNEDSLTVDEDTSPSASLDIGPSASELLFYHESLVLDLSGAIDQIRRETTIPSEFRSAADSEHTDQRAQAAISAIFPVLETLALGIDQKEMLRFMRLYEQGISLSGLTAGYSELIWCYDFVLNTMLDLEPLVQSVPLSRRRIKLSSVM